MTTQTQPHIPGITSAVVIPSDAPWLPESLRHRTDDVVINFRFSEGERRIYKRKKKGEKPSELIQKIRVMTSGPFEGHKIDFSINPFGADILDASFWDCVQEITICSAPQVVKTTFATNFLAVVAKIDPGTALVVYPDKDTTTENSRDVIQPMFSRSPGLANLVTGYDDDMSGKRIKLVSMIIYMGWAGSATSLGNKSARYLILDEKDKYPITPSKNEAGTSDLADKRTNAYRYNKKIINLSTPTIESGPIWQDMLRAEVIFELWARCPQCLTYQVMHFGDKESPTGIKWPADERDPEKIKNHDLAWYQCACGAKWDSHQRDKAVQMGELRAKGDGRELFSYLATYKPVHIAFHLPSWVSTFITLGKAAAAFLAGTKDKIKLRDFQNNHAAEPWLEYHQERNEDKIIRLCDDRPEGLVPGGGIVAGLTAGVDTQDFGCYITIRAWGYGLERESWLIRRCFVDSEEGVAKVLWENEYRDAAGNVYPVIFALRDAMGHRTDDAYEFCRQHRGQILPTKGERVKAQPWTYGNLEFFPGSKKPIPGGLQIVNISTKHFKDIISAKLEIGPTDPGAWHLHNGNYDPATKTSDLDDYASHFCAEVRDESGFWVPISESRPNHYWDCENLALVAAEILGIKYWPKPDLEEVQATEDSYETASAI